MSPAVLILLGEVRLIGASARAGSMERGYGSTVTART